LTAFFKQTYGWDLPQDFKVFELMKGERSGTYGFKFKICREVNVDEAGLNSLPKDNLLELIEKLSLEKGNLSTRGDESSETKINNIIEQLYAAMEIAHKKGWMSENQAKHYLNPQ